MRNYKIKKINNTLLKKFIKKNIVCFFVLTEPILLMSLEDQSSKENLLFKIIIVGDAGTPYFQKQVLF